MFSLELLVLCSEFPRSRAGAFLRDTFLRSDALKLKSRPRGWGLLRGIRVTVTAQYCTASGASLNGYWLDFVS